jgi:phosphatidylserine decarboxylase
VIAKIDTAAYPFVAIAAAPLVVCLFVGPAWLTVALTALPIAVALFFRDPDRLPPQGRSLVLSPADGVVMHAGAARPEESPAGSWNQVTIFLSVLDVHINRIPVAGVVERVEYVPGTFLAAFRRESHRNEHSEIWIDHDGVAVVVRQVVGLLARRVVCRVEPGDALQAGDRIGLMKFGSRMDVFIPQDAVVAVKTGDRVVGGMTVIARLGKR